MQLGAATGVQAHADLDSTTPAADAVLAVAPSSVDLDFTEPVEIAVGAIRVFAADGTRVDAGPLSHPAGDDRTAAVALRPGLTAGTYLVAWRIVSKDSHPVAGSYTFSVGRRGPVATGVFGTTDTSGLPTLLSASRFAVFGGVLMAGGTLSFLLLCWPGGWSRDRTRALLSTSLIVALIGTVVAGLVQAAYDAGRGLDGAKDPQVLQSLAQTRPGQAYGVRIALLLAVIVLLRGSLGDREWRPPSQGTAVAASAAMAAVLPTLSIAGHAGAGDGVVYRLPLDVAHLAAATLWAGGLPMVGLVVLSRLGPDDRERLEVVRRFSRLAGWCVGVLVATGVLQAWAQVGTWDALGGTPYGELLLGKIGLLTLILSLAAVSRAWVRGRLAEDRQDGTAPGWGGVATVPSATALRLSVLGEALLGVAVVAVTAALTGTAPPT